MDKPLYTSDGAHFDTEKCSLYKNIESSNSLTHYLCLNLTTPVSGVYISDSNPFDRCVITPNLFYIDGDTISKSYPNKFHTRTFGYSQNLFYQVNDDSISTYSKAVGNLTMLFLGRARFYEVVNYTVKIYIVRNIIDSESDRQVIKNWIKEKYNLVY